MKEVLFFYLAGNACCAESISIGISAVADCGTAVPKDCYELCRYGS
jgi:hypothetical protein